MSRSTGDSSVRHRFSSNPFLVNQPTSNNATSAAASPVALSIPQTQVRRVAGSTTTHGPAASGRRFSSSYSPSTTPPISHYVSSPSAGPGASPSGTPNFVLAGAGGSPLPPMFNRTQPSSSRLGSNTVAAGGGTASWLGLARSRQQQAQAQAQAQRRSRMTSSDTASFSSVNSTSTAASSRRGPIDASPSEWTFFGVHLTVTDVSAICASLQAGELAIDEKHDGTTASTLFRAAFGGDRWKVTIDQPASTSRDHSASLRLSLTAQLLDMSFYPNTIETSLMFSVRPPNESESERKSSRGEVWTKWVEEYAFSQDLETETWECDHFPSFETLLDNEQIRQNDCFVLSIQIATPASASVPRARDVRMVPSDMLAGLRGLLDDKHTSDVVIYVHERQAPVVPGSAASDLTATSEDGRRGQSTTPVPALRVRTLHAHRQILAARSVYFRDMLLSEGWAETSSFSSSHRVARGVVKIDDFDYETVYWLLRYLYTDEIEFEPIEDVRSHPSRHDLPSGWLDHVERLPWTWMTPRQVLDRIEVPHSPWSSQTERTTSVAGELADAVQRSPTQQSATVGTRTKLTSSLPTSRTRIISKRVPSSTSSTSSNRTTTTLTAASLAQKNRSGTSDASKSTPSKSTVNVVTTAGRMSPPSSLLSARASSFGEVGEELATRHAQDPHVHPVKVTKPASSFNIYRIAHRYGISRLTDLALDHIVHTLTPKTCFPLLLSTSPWPELHSAVKEYALDHFEQVCADPEFSRCYAEVGEGLWDDGGQVLLDFTLKLRPATS
ncbi:hypothetical protein ACM66B_005622 [Microbotryomycetes sp. NB124-2]